MYFKTSGRAPSRSCDAEGIITLIREIAAIFASSMGAELVPSSLDSAMHVSPPVLVSRTIEEQSQASCVDVQLATVI